MKIFLWNSDKNIIKQLTGNITYESTTFRKECIK